MRLTISVAAGLAHRRDGSLSEFRCISQHAIDRGEHRELINCRGFRSRRPRSSECRCGIANARRVANISCGYAGDAKRGHELKGAILTFTLTADWPQPGESGDGPVELRFSRLIEKTGRAVAVLCRRFECLRREQTGDEIGELINIHIVPMSRRQRVATDWSTRPSPQSWADGRTRVARLETFTSTYPYKAPSHSK